MAVRAEAELVLPDHLLLRYAFEPFSSKELRELLAVRGERIADLKEPRRLAVPLHNNTRVSPTTPQRSELLKL